MTSPTATGPSADMAQSLSKGAAGMALLDIERAHTGEGSWPAAHAWIKAATTDPINATDHASLYYGAPAISFVLHTAQSVRPGLYRTAVATIDAHVIRLAERRLAQARERVDRGESASFAEYDVFLGLSGLAALLLRHLPGHDILRPILRYLVHLIHPTREGLPGWWVNHNPDPRSPTPGGHANVGLAHGITGVLAVLAIALRADVSVDGQTGAVQRICAWLDQWEQQGETGPWWPQWITLQELDSGRTRQPGPARPSWCYGTVGIARAQQMAAIALGDTDRQRHAEHAMAACLTDPAQLRQLTEPGLCHGVAGVYQTAWRASRDALTPALSAHLPDLARLLRHQPAATQQLDSGLLTGATGLALALHTSTSSTPPYSGWDACLLIT